MTNDDPKPGRGGKRIPGPGKKLGRPRKTAAERTAITASVSMPKPAWDALDDRRGKDSRGKYIRRKLKLP